MEGDIIEINFLNPSASLDFIEVPLAVDFSQDIGLDENLVKFEGRFIEDRCPAGDFSLGQSELIMDGQAIIGDHLPPREKALGRYTNIGPGPENRLLGRGNRVP